MYIAHYKSVNSAKEFYSKPKKELNFAAQVEMNKERYMLNATFIANSPSLQASIENRAKELGIPFGVELI